MIRFIIALLSIISISQLSSQDMKIAFAASYMYQVPMGDLSDQYGNNSNVGGNLNIKFPSNWTLGMEGQILFGSTYKDMRFLGNMVNSDGFIIGTNFSPEIPEVQGRGGNFFLEAGKIFPTSKENKNSGIHVKAGLGYLFYSALVIADQRMITQISGEYSDGYNRLQSGLSYNSYLGYTFYSKNKLINGSLGLQMTYANMKYEGNIDFATGKPLDKSGFSNILIGPKLSFYLILKTINKTEAKTDGYYYN